MAILTIYFNDFNEKKVIEGEGSKLIDYAKGLAVTGESYQWVVEEYSKFVNFKGISYQLCLRAENDYVAIWLSQDGAENETLLTYVTTWDLAKAWRAGWAEAIETF